MDFCILKIGLFAYKAKTEFIYLDVTYLGRIKQGCQKI